MNPSNLPSSHTVTPQPARGGFLHNLGSHPAVHRLVHVLGVYRAANSWLRAFPKHKRTAKTGLEYRIRSVSSLVLEEELFRGTCYDRAILERPIETFIDLGSNVGWFACLLAERTGKKDFTGLLVDADPRMVEESQWHIEANNLSGCRALLGLAGLSPTSEEATFYVNPADTQSSAIAFGENHPFPVKGTVKSVKVPVLDLEREWRKTGGDREVDLLKIDIEGMELEFVKVMGPFLQQQVRRAVCEWHAWLVPFADLQQAFEAIGFTLVEICEQDELGGVAVFDRR